MPTLLLAFVKQSDWLEAWSSMMAFPEHDIECHFIENTRNTMRSMEYVFGNLPASRRVSLIPHATKEEWMQAVQGKSWTLATGDVVAAPFMQYQYPWRVFPIKRLRSHPTLGNLPRYLSAGVTSIHLSESLADSLGVFGYQLGYRPLGIKSLPILLLAPFYAATHKPNLCFYPAFPHIRNPFVRETRRPYRPPLHSEKLAMLRSLGGEGEKRPLLVGGFGYNAFKMADCLGHSRYWATSKNKEICLDGIMHPLDFHISAEDVLLSGLVSEIVSYPSTCVYWARQLEPEMPITCLDSSQIRRIYSPFFRRLAAHSLARIGVRLLPENPAMLD